MTRKVTTVEGMRFEALGSVWRGRVGKVVVDVEQRPEGTWRWSLSKTVGDKKWWGVAKERGHAMALGVQYAKDAATERSLRLKASA
jgi:hypothetical protein